MGQRTVAARVASHRDVRPAPPRHRRGKISNALFEPTLAAINLDYPPSTDALRKYAYPIIISSLFYICALSPRAFAETGAALTAKANRMYQAQKYDQALKLYNEALIKNPDSAEISYNIGSAQFKKGDYKAAIESFEKATVTREKKLEAKANYNIANSKYKLGKLKENTNLAATVQLLQESLDYYKRSIELDSRDEDAKVNHELVEKELKVLLDRLKQQQEEAKNKPQKEQGEQKQESKEGEGTKQEGEEKKQPQEQPGKEENKGQEQKQAQEEKTQEQQQSAEKTQEQNQEQPEQAQAVSPEDTKEMSKNEATMLLDGFRQQENGRGQIQDRRQGYEAGVLKDW